MLEIDGSMGEGGGQILRTSVSLSAVLGIPVRITRVRANRPKPGLRPQHLTGLTAMAELCSAGLTGAAVGSTEVVFSPGATRPGEYRFDVSRISGSAGSVTLVMQTLLPALVSAGGPSKVMVKGGTHVAWSPPFEFFAESFLPAVRRMGVTAAVDITMRGYYPKGGGEVSLKARPSLPLRPIELTERGGLIGVRGVSAVSNLPPSIAARQAEAASQYLRARGIASEITTLDAPSPGTGTSIYLSVEFENTALGFSALGERGKRAEKVGEEAASALVEFMESGACVEEHLADQLVPYMALAGGKSSMSVARLTRHLVTNIDVVRKFLPDLSVRVEGTEGGPGTVTIVGRGLQSSS